MTKRSKIQTIDVDAKEWFDRVNGNSYFSARVTINYGMKDAKTLYLPFQYGYGSQYECEAFKLVKGFAPHLRNEHQFALLSHVCRENEIILRSKMQENCKQKDVKIWGTE